MSRPLHNGRRRAGGRQRGATASRRPLAARTTTPRPERDGTPQRARAAAPLVRPGHLAFTIVTASHGRPLAKRFWLDNAGELKSKTVVALTRGTARIEYAPSLTE